MDFVEYDDKGQVVRVLTFENKWYAWEHFFDKAQNTDWNGSWGEAE